MGSECGRSSLPPSQAAKCRGVKESAPLVLEILSVSISHGVLCHEVPESACLSPPLIVSMGPKTVAALLENCLLDTVRGPIFTPWLSLA